VDSDFPWSHYSQFYLFTLNLDNRYPDIIADGNRFALLSGKDQHPCAPVL
jgi:hypothetical protein